MGIRIEALHKRYGEGETAVDALRGVDLQVAPGEVVGLIGPSGSGKSTLLKCLGAVIEPTSGRMTLGDQVIYDDGWKIRDLRALRRDKIGFVFQAPYLIPFLDATDNVALLPMLAGRSNAEARARALEVLTALDVGHRALGHALAALRRRAAAGLDRPGAGQWATRDPGRRAHGAARQRAGPRRHPHPAREMAHRYETAIIVVTHDEKIIPTFKRIYHIRDGRTLETAGEGRDAGGSAAAATPRAAAG